jgi:hypothetical protein
MVEISLRILNIEVHTLPCLQRGDENDMISIAFGAPYICSLELAEEVNGNEELKSHFFSFVHEDDPAISILNGREDHNDGDSEYEADRWGYFEGSAGFWSEVDQLRKAIVQVIRRVFGPPTSKNHQQQIKFFLIGENTHLKASQWSVSRYVPQMPIKLWSGSSYVPQVPIKQWSFYDSYKSALLEGKAPVTGNSPSDAGLNLALNVTTPAPKVCVSFLLFLPFCRKTTHPLTSESHCDAILC